MTSRRLVCFGGTGPAVGKTTLSKGLAAALPGSAWIDELVVLEDPMFADLAEGFGRKAFPGPDALLDGWAQLLDVHADATWIVNDGSWVWLGEDLPCAQSWTAIVTYASGLLDLARDLEPVLFFLRGDDDATYRRHVARDGRAAADAWVATGDPAAWVARCRRILDESGWPVVELDATQPADAVLRDALAALRAG